GDRVEHGRGRPLEFDGGALVREDRLDCGRHATHERDLDEDQGLVNQGGVKECVATPVGGIDACAQIVPVTDRVYGLVADDLLQQARRRRPVDFAQHQEAAV